MSKEFLDWCNDVEPITFDVGQFSFGNRVKLLREIKGITIEDITSKYPISESSILELDEGGGSVKDLIIYLGAVKELEEFLKQSFRNTILRYEVLNAPLYQGYAPKVS